MLMAVPTEQTVAPEAPWYAQALTALTATYQQQQINKINLERARQGLDPLPPSATATTVNVGLPPEQMRQIMLLGGGAILLIALVMLSQRRR